MRFSTWYSRTLMLNDSHQIRTSRTMKSRKYPWHLHVSFWYPSPPAHRLQGILNLQDMPFWGSPCVCVCARVRVCGNPISVGLHACLLNLTSLGLVSSLRSCFPPSKTTIYTHGCSFFPASFSSKYYSYIFITRRGLSSIPPTCGHRWVHFLKFTWKINLLTK